MLQLSFLIVTIFDALTSLQIDALTASYCSTLYSNQNFILSDELTNLVSEKSVKSIYGAISTGCPTNGKSFLNNNVTFSDNTNIFYFNFTLITTAYGGNMIQRQSTIEQASNEKLCLTNNDRAQSLGFDKCNDF